MQLQQDNSSSISNNDVIAILKQSLQSLESFKQEVQMLKEAKDNVRPTLTSPAPQFPLLEVAQSQLLLHSTSQAGSEDSEATRTMKIRVV